MTNYLGSLDGKSDHHRLVVELCNPLQFPFSIGAFNRCRDSSIVRCILHAASCSPIGGVFVTLLQVPLRRLRRLSAHYQYLVQTRGKIIILKHSPLSLCYLALYVGSITRIASYWPATPCARDKIAAILVVSPVDWVPRFHSVTRYYPPGR